jgi:hypothetical protein
MFRYWIRHLLNKTKKIDTKHSDVLFTGCRRLETDDAVADKLFGKVTDVNFVSTTWLSIRPVVVADWRLNDGSVYPRCLNYRERRIIYSFLGYQYKDILYKM